MTRLILSAVLGFFLGAIMAGILEIMGVAPIDFGSPLCLALIGIGSGISYLGLSNFFDKKEQTTENQEEKSKQKTPQREPRDGEILIHEIEVPVEPETVLLEETPPQPEDPTHGKRANDV